MKRNVTFQQIDETTGVLTRQAQPGSTGSLLLSEAEAYLLYQCLPSAGCEELAKRLEALFDPAWPRVVKLLTDREWQLI